MEEEEISPPVAGDEVPEVPVEAEIATEVENAVAEETEGDPKSTTEVIDPADDDVAVVNEENGVEGDIDGYVVHYVLLLFPLLFARPPSYVSLLVCNYNSDGEIAAAADVEGVVVGDAVETGEDELNVSTDDVNISSSDAELAVSPVIQRKPQVTKDVVTGMRIAMGYDDVSQFKTDGFDMSCCVLSEGGLETEKEEMWKFHVMSMTASLSSVQAAARAAALTIDNTSSSGSTNLKKEETATGEGEEAVAAVEGEDVAVADADAAVNVATDETVVESATTMTNLLLAVEDVIWVSANKASGEPPVLPDGYTLLSDTDLLAGNLATDDQAGGEDSVYLAVRMGPVPRIAGIRMYCAPALATTSASADTAAEGEGEAVPSPMTMESLIAGCFPNREVAYRAAPPAIEALHQQGPCGLLLEYISESALLEEQQEEDAEDVAAIVVQGSEGQQDGGSSSQMVSAVAGGHDDGWDEAALGMTTDNDMPSDVRDNNVSFGGADNEMMGGVPVTIVDEEGDEEAQISQRKTAETAKNKREGRHRRTEDDLVADLESRYLAFEMERTHILAQNSELQKRAAALIAREKANIQSKNAASGLGSAAAGAAGNIPSDEQAQASTANDLQTAADAESEKEKIYVDTLQKIVNGRVKLERQQSEFDQLSLDLQVISYCIYRHRLVHTSLLNTNPSPLLCNVSSPFIRRRVWTTKSLRLARSRSPSDTSRRRSCPRQKTVAQASDPPPLLTFYTFSHAI